MNNLFYEAYDPSEAHLVECPNCGELVLNEYMVAVGDPSLNYNLCEGCADVANNPQDYKWKLQLNTGINKKKDF